MTSPKSFCKQYFCAIVVALIFIKLLLVADIAVHIRFSPFDDSLYVDRAYAFLIKGGWGGSYDAYVLAKIPGMSFWLVANRWLGIPYLLSINLFYCLAGLLLIRAAARAGVEDGFLLIAYSMFLCNPITFAVEWALVMREALSSVITITLLGISLKIMVSSKDKLPSGWMLAWGLIFAFGQLLREEDRLLWAYLILFGGASMWLRRDAFTHRIKGRFAILMLFIPALLSSLVGYGVRSYHESLFGAPILSDYSEGEFPRLMATLRSIESPIDNRLVMLPQEVIQKLRPLVPDFAPVLDRLPAPGIHTFSCKSHGVCDEWSNGWMPWWVKQASAEAGLTPTLVAGQEYFKSIREQIEALCQQSHLRCRFSGEGIIPPMEFRWFRSYIQEFSRIAAMLIYPKVSVVSASDQPVNASRDLVERYQHVTMTSVTENPLPDRVTLVGTLQAELRGTFAVMGAFLNGLAVIVGMVTIIWRGIMYPSVPVTPIYLLCLAFFGYSLIRLLALAYVAVFLGPFEPRIVFSTYTGLGLLGVFAVWDSIQARKKFQFLRYKYA